MDPTKPGWQTTEGWTTAFKALAGTAALFCSLFGIGLPASAGPSGQWVGVAAFLASTVAVAVYGRQRTALKKQVAVLDATTIGTPAVTSEPFVPVTVSDAGIAVIGAIGLGLALIGMVLVLIAAATVPHTLSVTGLVLLVIGVVLLLIDAGPVIRR